MMSMLDCTHGLVSHQALSMLGVAKLSGSTAVPGNCDFISGSKLASNRTFQIRAFDLCFVLLNGCVYVIAVHNMGRAILLWGTGKKEKKNLKNCSGIHCHAMTGSDDSFPARAGRSVEIFSFFTTGENQRVAMPVKSGHAIVVCLAHYAVSNYDPKQVPRKGEEESKCMWYFPGMLLFPPAVSGNTVCLVILNRVLLQVYSVVPVGILEE